MNKKRIVSLLLSFALILGLMPVLSQTAYADTTSYQLWVGGIPVTSANASDILGEGDVGVTASYEESTKTLILNNYSYEGNGYKYIDEHNTPSHYAAIYADHDLTIQLIGHNTVKCKEIDSSIGDGIHICSKSGNLTIEGSGTLTTAGYGDVGIGIFTEYKNITINGGTVTASASVGLSANGGIITINNGIVTASSSRMGISTNNLMVADDMGINAGYSKKNAINVDKESFNTNHPQTWVQIAKAYPLWVGGKQVISANASDVLGDNDKVATVKFTPAKDDDSETTEVDESAPATLTLNGATITETYNAGLGKGNCNIYSKDIDLKLVLEGTNTVGSDGLSNDYAIFVNDNSNPPTTGNLTIEGSGSLTAYGDDAAIYASKNIQIKNGLITAKSNGDGICVSYGHCNISGGNVTANGETYGIRTDGGDVTISNGIVNTYGYFGISSTGATTISGGTVKASGQSGIRAVGNVEITGGTVTANGEEGCGIITDSGSITVGKSVSGLIATGKAFAFGSFEGTGYKAVTIKNAIAGTGWTDAEGTIGQEKIEVSTSGQSISSLSKFKKMQFPAVNPPSGGGMVDYVGKVVKMINDLPEPDKVTVDDEKAIKEAREAYDKLSDTQKQDRRLTQAIKNKLEDCETALDKAKKDKEDQETADKVSKQIETLPADPSEAAEADAQAAYGAYMALTAAQKELLSDKAKQKVAAYKYFYEVRYAEAQKVKLSSVKANKGGKAITKWKKNKAVDGYRLCYKAKGVKAKYVNIKSYKIAKTTVKKLKAGKVYSFKVRPYTKVNDPSTGKTKKVYGKWSKVKKIKAKK